MKYNDNGTYKDIYVKAIDTLPVGSEVDYDGQTVPAGWEEVDYEDYVDFKNQITTSSPNDLEVVKAIGKQYGNMTTLNIIVRSSSGLASGGASPIVMTLPAKYKPTNDIISMCRLTQGYDYPTWDGVNGVTTFGFFKIGTDGKVNIRYPSAYTMKVAQILITY